VAAAAHTWSDELRDQVRGFSGGLLFGIPLLFTMEVWWTGSHTSVRQMSGILALTFAVVIVLNRVASFRSEEDHTTFDAVLDAVEAVAMGLLVSFLVLVVTREVGPGIPGAEVLGKVVYHGITASIGVALAGQFFRGAADVGEGDAGGGDDTGELLGTVVDLGASALGTVFVASAIAPTDEIPMLEAATTPGWLLVVVAFSLAVSYCVVYVSGFANQEQRHLQKGVLQHPVTETVVAYLVALLVCGVLLVLYQRVDLVDPWQLWLPDVILLGLPAAIGGAAGRLAV
jgi:putative integral membrane protein (TIGR02587 family)